MSSTSDDSEAAIASPQLTCWSPNSGRAYTFTEIASSTNIQLHQLDSGRCLLSCEKTPREAVHIFPRNLKHQVLANYGTVWNKSALNLNSAQNLVTYMHISFNNGDWALVPTENILNKILKNKNHTFDKPYRGFNPNKKHDYVYVRVPQEEDEEEYTDDMDTDEDDEEEEEDEYADEYEYVQGDTDTAMDGNPQLNIPVILKHHAHPFYVIDNALLKLRKRRYLLNAEHFQLYRLMEKIDSMWVSRLARQPSQNLALKRRRSPSAGSNNDDTNHRQVKRGKTKAVAAKREVGPGPDRTSKSREIRDRARIGKQKGRARGALNATPSRLREFLSATPSESGEESDDDSSEITAWAEEVAAAGPPDVPDETIVWPDKERVRKPIQEWHRWRTPYNQPKERSKFSSSDWSMVRYSKALWMPSLRKRKKG